VSCCSGIKSPLIYKVFKYNFFYLFFVFIMASAKLVYIRAVQPAASSQQQAASSKQQAASSKQQAASSKQQARLTPSSSSSSSSSSSRQAKSLLSLCPLAFLAFLACELAYAH
jgi:predicted negative regulator of RcsB-dependent stress response